MRWFFCVYVFLCFGLFSFLFIFLNGYQFQGLPLGTHLGDRDLALVNYKGLKSIARQSLGKFKSMRFSIQVEGRSFDLEYGRDFYLQVDQNKLLSEYRRFRSMIPWYLSIYQFVTGKFKKHEFEIPIELSREKTLKSLHKRFKKKENILHKIDEDSLVKIAWTLDLDEVLDKIKTSALSVGNRKQIPFQLTPVKHTEVLQRQTLFHNLISEEKRPLSSGDRGFGELNSILEAQRTVLLNPEDSFSCLEFLIKNQITSMAVSTKTTTVDGIEFYDFHGLSLFSSLLFRTFLRLGFQIDRHSHHPYFFSKIDYLKPGLDSRIGGNDDLRVVNTTRQPFLLMFSFENGYFQISAFSCFDDYPKPWLREAYRKIEYADMTTILDPTLQKGQKMIMRKPISGMAVGIYRMWKNPRGKTRRKQVWKAHYSSLNGIIHVGREGINVFHPESWKDLGIEESFAIRAPE